MSENAFCARNSLSGFSQDLLYRTQEHYQFSKNPNYTLHTLLYTYPDCQGQWWCWRWAMKTDRAGFVMVRGHSRGLLLAGTDISLGLSDPDRHTRPDRHRPQPSRDPPGLGRRCSTCCPDLQDRGRPSLPPWGRRRALHSSLPPHHTAPTSHWSRTHPPTDPGYTPHTPLQPL